MICFSDMQIFIRSARDAKTLTIEVLRTDTIEDLKIRIKEKNGMELEDQTLTYKGARMDNDKTIGDYGIKQEETLLLTQTEHEQEFQFFVIIPAGNAQKTRTIKDVGLDDTVEKLREKLAEDEGFDLESIYLVLNGKPLRNDATLRDQGFYEECSVFLSLRVHGG